MQISNDLIYFPDKQLLGFGSGERWVMDDGGDFAGMQVFIDAHSGKYIFTCLSYDLKNELEDLKSENPDAVEFPIIVLWSPDYVVDFSNSTFIQGKETPEIRDYAFLLFQRITETEPSDLNSSIHFESRITRDTYINSVNQVKAEIQYGNCYELNFCQEFYAENVGELDTTSMFRSIHQKTQAPFSVFLNFEDWSVMCFSPERYIQKVGVRLISQPIKGTIRRGVNAHEDAELKQKLQGDKKEVSENVMITDLVRNDFSKIAKKGSVHVAHLCELQTFETLHHLVSTIACDIETDVNFESILRASFPMGSMTGAPKVRVMQLIEEHESFRRGLYSGSIGLIYPNGDFDFNVIIRSLLHNKRKQILSCSVGSAITMKSDPEKEYEECLVKVNKILQFFT
jgi:para-aminobenzoate synthetase component 1